MSPTPDANLHLGHMCGPYISADITNRAFKLQKIPSMLVSGIDAFENWCEDNEKSKANKIYNDQIKSFRLLKIDFDRFENPLNDTYFNKTYKKTLRQTFEAFKKDKNFFSEKEEILQDNNKFGFGANIYGDCPNCSQKVRGNICVSCFYYFQPNEILNPKMSNQKSDHKLLENFFFKISEDNLIDFQKICDNKIAIKTIENWYANSSKKIRLSYQGDFGITISNKDKRIIRNTFLQYFISLINFNPNLKNKNLSLYLFMGLDNIIPCGLGSIALPCPENITISYLQTNNMLFYQDKKFSKSKKHGPTVLTLVPEDDWVQQSGLRLFLISINLSEKSISFCLKKYKKFQDKYNSLISNFIRKYPEPIYIRHDEEVVFNIARRYTKNSIKKEEILSIYLSLLEQPTISYLTNNQKLSLYEITYLIDPNFNERKFILEYD